MRRSPLTAGVVALAVAPALVLAACGGSEADPAQQFGQTPEASAFPDPQGRTLEEIATDVGLTEEIVVAPTGQVARQGENRYGFGVFSVTNEPINDAEVGLYVAPAAGGKVHGPYPATVQTLETDARYRAESTAADSDSAKAVYSTEVDLSEPGEWRVVAVINGSEGQSRAVRVPSIVVGPYEVPKVGEKAPLIHTPTGDDVADLSQIDTRNPHDTMHDVDFAKVVGEEPVVLLFATPALCQSRVCGPVVDVAEQVKAERPDDAAYIHMEIYEDNTYDPKNLLDQVKAYQLPTEPWLFVIDSKGRVSTVIEGAFSVAELNAALDGLDR